MTTIENVTYEWFPSITGREAVAEFSDWYHRLDDSFEKLDIINHVIDHAENELKNHGVKLVPDLPDDVQIDIYSHRGEARI